MQGLSLQRRRKRDRRRMKIETNYKKLTLTETIERLKGMTYTQQPYLYNNEAIFSAIDYLTREITDATPIPDEYIKLGAKIALQGVKEEINNITEEMTRKGVDTKYFEPIKAFVDDRLAESEEK